MGSSLSSMPESLYWMGYSGKPGCDLRPLDGHFIDRLLCAQSKCRPVRYFGRKAGRYLDEVPLCTPGGLYDDSAPKAVECDREAEMNAD